MATVWLLKHGYEVFRNVSSSGPADLVAWDTITGEKLLIDCKKLSTNIQKGKEYQGWGSRSEEQAKMGVWLLVVDIKTGDCFWSDNTKTWKGKPYWEGRHPLTA